jgi:hypothetical protein
VEGYSKSSLYNYSSHSTVQKIEIQLQNAP